MDKRTSITFNIDDQHFKLKCNKNDSGNHESENLNNTYNTYKIRTISDMLRVVKKESLPQFLEDLSCIFNFNYCMKELNQEISIIEEFEWIDDGNVNLNATIKCSTNDISIEEKEKIMSSIYERCDKI